jgi:geranylgeranyl diphosphate synthase type I
VTLELLARYRDRIVDGLRAALSGQGPLGDVLCYHAGLVDESGNPADALGKLLRPALVLLTAEDLGGRLEDAVPAAVGLELVHEFSLIHDDVQDRDATRRGRPSVWSIWGVAEAINAGDLMQALAVRTALRAGPEPARLLVEATAEMIEGQSMDLDFEDRFVSPEEVLAMIDRKTGALFRCAFELGGVCAGAGADLIELLRSLGRSIGRAFQIRDDLLGIWGDGEVTGKPVGSDVRRRKKSYPLALGASRAAGGERVRLEAIYARDDLEDGDVVWVVALLDRLGVRARAAAAVDAYVAEAKSAVAAVPFRSEARDLLGDLITFLARRET